MSEVQFALALKPSLRSQQKATTTNNPKVHICFHNKTKETLLSIHFLTADSYQAREAPMSHRSNRGYSYEEQDEQAHRYDQRKRSHSYENRTSAAAGASSSKRNRRGD